jgi:hypothetical protein
MKKALQLSLTLIAILFFSTSAIRPASHHDRYTTYNFYIQNGTAWNGTVTGSGALYTPSPVAFGTTGQYFIKALTPSVSYITVTITCAASGSHTYGLTGGVSPVPTPIVTSSGTATFTGVSVIPGDIDGYIH